MATRRAIPEPTPELRERAQRIFELLVQTYGEPGPSGDRPEPLDDLIGTILSQHTSDVNSAAAFRSLKARFPTWDLVLEADEAAIAEAIRSGGLANVKAARIKQVLRTIKARYGRLDLDWLTALPMAEAREVLTGLDGVGPKTAACVLLFSLGMPALPVDTHVHRVAGRLGLIPPKMGAEAAHVFLERLIPAEQVYPFHIDLIRHGRRICKAGLPRCGECPLIEECDYGRRALLGTEPNSARSASRRRS